jgi:hypothetical protein
MRLHPRKSWHSTTEGLRPPFAIEGAVRGFSPGDVTSISASEVWTPVARTRHHSKSRSETVVEADALDLKIIERRPREKAGRGRMKVHTNYLLTESVPLKPLVARGTSYTGEITMEDAEEFDFTLANGTRLRFTQHYRYEEREDGLLTYPELVAVHEHEMRPANFGQVDEQTLDQLDDFLALVGFGARYRVACLGITASSEHADMFRFYRKRHRINSGELRHLSVVVPLIDGIGIPGGVPILEFP